MHLPNYKDGSIVNLMSSIKKSLGGKHPYEELKILPSKNLKNKKNIVLIVIDGLGFEFLKQNIKGTIFEKNLKGKMTSVFPATTASAITTFNTGFPPQQTALTGWYMYLKELGILSTTLPFNPRLGGPSFSEQEIDIKKVYNDLNGFTKNLKINSYIVKPEQISNSHFTNLIKEKSKTTGSKNLNDFFKKITQIVKNCNRKKYVFSYWDEFDALAHTKGIQSKETINYFKKLDVELKKFVKNMKGTNTKIILTSDHGFLDSKKKDLIKIEKHPELKDCLLIPLAGDSRIAYCYLKQDKIKKFKNYINNNLKDKVYMYKSEDLIKKGFFGLFKENPKLIDRIGDYTLIAKNNYTIKDTILDKEKKFKKGRHSGVSKEEMLVPLVIFDV